jgi:hypothetical protein
MTAAKGFCTSFKHIGDGQLEKCEKVNRFKTFEFLSIFYIIHKQQKKIKTIYSNFSQNGFMTIQNYPLDLAIVFEDGTVEMTNVDGFFAHGCRQKCKDLKSYVQYKNRQDLENDSQKRDDVISTWCLQINQKLNANVFSYQIKTDCHDKEFSKKTLTAYFHQHDELKKLISNYFTSNVITQDDLLFAHEDLTFIATLQGFIPNLQCNPLLVQNEEKKWNRSNSTNNKDIIMTRDYLQYLIKTFNFQVTTISKVFVYKKCTDFSKVYQALIDKRTLDATSNSEKQLIKNIVNFSAGFYGYNAAKHQSSTSVRLVDKLGRYFNVMNTMVQPAENIEDMSFLILKKHCLKKFIHRKACQTALPLYVMITEFGKLRLSQIMNFFEKFLMPNKYHFTYSQIDNLIIILTTETLEEAVYPHLLNQYLAEKLNFFSVGPGMLTEEFNYGLQDNWQFVTGCVQNYCIISNRTNIHKNSSLSNITSTRSFEASVAMLNRETISIPQERRVDKMCNTDTIVKNFNLTSHL